MKAVILGVLLLVSNVFNLSTPEVPAAINVTDAATSTKAILDRTVETTAAGIERIPESRLGTSESQVLTTEPHVVTKEPYILTNEPHVTTSAVPAITSEPLVVTSGNHVMTNEPQVLTSEPHVMTSNVPVTTSEPHPMTNEPGAAVSPVSTNAPVVVTTEPDVLTTRPQSTDVPPTEQRLEERTPVWTTCLPAAETDTSQDGFVPLLMKQWCSNYNATITCLEQNLTTQAPSNPLDAFARLHFNGDVLRSRSEQLCRSFYDIRGQLECTRQRNETLVSLCQSRFAKGLQYVFAVQREKIADVGFYKELACQVTLDTSGCLGAAMTGCDTNVKRDVLNYYAIFTNETCVANPSVAYTTPTPPRREPEDVVIACAKLIAESLPRSAAPPKDASRVAQVIHGLRENCRSFEARYNCYDEKLNQIRSPAFRDLWLMSTFSSKNAIKAQKEFCEAFEGGLVNSFTDQCYADAQPSLQECEMSYGEEIVSLQSQWLSRAIDDVGLRKAACNVSLTRATCLGRAFSHCGDRLGKIMETSERGSLPSICLTLLSPPPRESEHDRGDNRAPKAVPEQDGNISSGYSNVNDNSVTSDLGARESSVRKQSGNSVSASQSSAGNSAVAMEISVAALVFAFVLRGALLA